MHIRTATIADIPLIRELTMQVWPHTYIPIVGEEQVNYMLNSFYSAEALQEQIEAGHRFIIGYSDDIPVAFASYSGIAPGIYKLNKLYIITGQQGKGIGNGMVTYVINDIKGRGATALRLNVNIYNTPAMAFYKKMGFTHFKDEDIDIGSGYYMNDHVLTLPVC